MADGGPHADVSTPSVSFASLARNSSGAYTPHPAAQPTPDNIPKEMTSSDVILISTAIIVIITVVIGCLGVIRGIIFWIRKREELADLQLRIESTADLASSESSHTRTLHEIRRERRLRILSERSARGVSSTHRYSFRNQKGLTPLRIAQLGGVFEYEGAGEVRVGDEEEGTPECSVCLDSYQAGEELRRLGVCGHVFHQECLDSWLEIHGTCPLCRKTVYACPHSEHHPKAQAQGLPHEAVTEATQTSFPDAQGALPHESSRSTRSEEGTRPNTHSHVLGGITTGDGVEVPEVPRVTWRVVRVGSGLRPSQVASHQGASVPGDTASSSSYGGEQGSVPHTGVAVSLVSRGAAPQRQEESSEESGNQHREDPQSSGEPVPHVLLQVPDDAHTQADAGSCC